MVTVTSLPFSSSTLRSSASAYLRPSWKMWPISTPRASSSGPEPSGAGSPGSTSAASTVPSQAKSRPATRSKTCLPGSLAPGLHRGQGTTRGAPGGRPGGLDGAGPGEVPAGDEVEDVPAGLVGAGDPPRAGHDARVHEVADLRLALGAPDLRAGVGRDPRGG